MRVSSIMLVLAALAAVAAAQSPTMPQLPAGHPEIPNLAPATRPAAHGTLTVRALQGTQGGPAVAGDDVTVELYHQQQVIRKLEGRLNQNGIITFDGISLLLPFEPVVTLTHGGVQYQQSGRVMDNQRPLQQIDLTVFETTEQAPPWQVHMQHVLVDTAGDKVNVTEMLAIENPTDRAWIGTTGADGKRTTLIIRLPDGAADVRTAGAMHDCCARFENGTLTDINPLKPGITQVQISYTLPVRNGQARLVMTAPAAIKRTMVVVPDNGTAVKADGLQMSGKRDIGRGPMQIFSGADLKPGQQVSLTAYVSRPAPVAAAHTRIPKIVVGVGAALILVVGAVVIFVRSPKVQPN